MSCRFATTDIYPVSRSDTGRAVRVGRSGAPGCTAGPPSGVSWDPSNALFRHGRRRRCGDVRRPLDQAEAVGGEDAGDGREVVADDRPVHGAAVAPVAEVAEQLAAVGGLVERLAGEGRGQGDVGQAPEPSAVEGVDLGPAHLEGAEQAVAG